jgi:hypothetical protein
VFSCPFPACGTPISHDHLRRLRLFVPTWDKATLARLAALDKEKHLPCPTCRSRVLVGDAPLALGQVPLCGNCGTRMCQPHGRLLPCGACHAQCHAERTRVQAIFVRYARASLIRLCPACANPIEKISGCDHMRCLCGARFLWSEQEGAFSCSAVGQCSHAHIHFSRPLGGLCKGCKRHTLGAACKLFAWRFPLFAFGVPVACAALALCFAGVAIASGHCTAYIAACALLKSIRMRWRRRLAA